MNHTGNGNGRAKNGTFQKGNKLSPGRKPRATEKEYLEVTFANCTLTDWKKICKKATADAAQGDKTAREWLSRYLLPSKMDEPLEPQQAPVYEIQVVSQRAKELTEAILRGEGL